MSQGYYNADAFPVDKPAASALGTRLSPTSLRIAFIHPDLGIGGAERLVVDAAVGLQKRGHHVEVFTSHHEDGEAGRSFEETRDGTLSVHVLGNSIFPTSVRGRFTILCSILRQFHLALSFILASHLTLLSSLPFASLFLLPLSHPYTSSADWSPRRQLIPFDVVVVDQLSAAIPLLRWLGANRIVFYCHFPDLLLSPGRAYSGPGARRQPWSVGAQLRSVYRVPIDKFEEATTGEADKILVNSEFTSRVFQRTFPLMRRAPRVVYPGIDVSAYGKPVVATKEDAWLINNDPVLLSINRFEGKKDIALAIDAFARARVEYPTLRLVLAGGYDSRLADNVITLAFLQQLTTAHGLTHTTFSATPLSSATSPLPAAARSITLTPPTSLPQVLFLLNMTHAHKALLLASPSVAALLYTPSHEHLGIVPLEAMAAGLPVLATDTGGPTETIIDDGLDGKLTTGLLRVPAADVWATAIKDLLALPVERRREIGMAGQVRVKAEFSVEKLAEGLEKACRDAAEVEGPIAFETGALKLAAFLMIGGFVLTSGLIAFYVGHIM